MQERISVEILKTRLRRTTWIPLGIMAALFLVTTGYILFQEHQGHIASIRFALHELIRSQETLISQDILMGQEEGIKLRTDAILESWREKYPEVQACIQYTLNPPNKSPKKGEACAIESQPGLASIQKDIGHFQVAMGSDVLAEISYGVIRPATLTDIFPPVLLGILALGFLVAILSHRSLVKGVETKVLSPLLQQITRDERDAAIAQTTRMIAHDVRKPFRLLQLAVTRLRQAKNKQARELGEQIESEIGQSVRSVDSMMRDILDVSRKMKPNLETVSIGSLMDRLSETITQLHPKSSVSLRLDFRRRHRVTADPEQLMRVLMNLVENAYQATGENGTVKMTAREIASKGGSRIEFVVQNNGPVIPEEDLGQLFTPYFTKKKDGTGLGLTIAKKIVEEHGGDLLCTSSAEAGTAFLFSLPSSAKNAQPVILKESSDSKEGLDAIREHNILIFDDEKIVRDHWSTHAKKQGFHTVLDFKSWEDFVSQEGFKLVDQNTVAFVDIHYKNSSHTGIEIARNLKRVGVRKIYAITSDMETAQESGLFTEVFGKDIPKNFTALVG